MLRVLRSGALALVCLLAVGGAARAGETPPEGAPAPPFSLGLFAVPDASASPIAAPKRSLRRRFRTALGELALTELLPWIYDRYIENEDFARISWHTLSENWKAGFAFDTNEFRGNEDLHPFQGSLFFESGRSNGFSYWESGLFALAGSLIWEYAMENERPSTNDIVNTPLGGMVRGEVQHRLSRMLLDNTASGDERFWRELGAAVLNPVGSLTRLINGDLDRVFPNPEDRLPDGFAFSADAGYRRVGGPVAYPDQGTIAFSARYGDPFGRDVRAPFEAFRAYLELAFPGDPVIDRLEERGVLASWALTERGAAARHVFAVSQEFEYVNNGAEVFGAQAFSGGVLSRFVLPRGLDVETDLEGVAIPLAAVGTGPGTESESASVRAYDFGSGGGALAAVRLRSGEVELLDLGYAVAWLPTVDGPSRFNTVQFFRAAAAVPLPFAPGFRLGGGWRWYRRQTSFPGGLEARQTQSEWRLFVRFAFGEPPSGRAP